MCEENKLTDEQMEQIETIHEKYGDEIFIWVDDKPWRFIGHGDENTEYVWYYFPFTAKFVEKNPETQESEPGGPGRE